MKRISSISTRANGRRLEWLALLLLFPAPSIAQQQDPLPYTCDWYNDACPWAADNECDAAFAPSLCGNGDCLDCDPAQAYHYTSCHTCTANRGYWCPGDAICYSELLTAEYWAHDEDTPFTILGDKTITKCPTVDDWIGSTEDCDAAAAASTNVYSDPLYDSMAWQYQLINIEAVWRQNITGAGVHVRVNDDGVDATHPEFAGRFDIEHSCPNYLPDNTLLDDHGTSCASIIAGNTDNGECSTGIAPGVTLSACALLSWKNGYTDAEGIVSELETVDVSSNSWGPLPCSPDGNGIFFRRKLGTSRQLNCDMFTFDHQNHPCNICDTSEIDLSNDDCGDAVAFHCLLFFEHDPEACIEYLDAFVDCEYDVMPEETHDAFVTAVTEGRDGKGIIFSKLSRDSNPL